ncbi:MAG: N-acetyl-gamma-glutamyl-phosphate reductase [Anaerolineales bacterium]|nr:N-acetyl-gamma-glutamyl-phosphate reductase [Anaerolineales bacterium]
MTNTFRAGIAGATGYTGIELVTWIDRHPQLEIGWITSENSAGKSLADVHAVPWTYPLIPLAEAFARTGDVDVVFLCLPHGESIEAAQRFAASGVRVIDLSADFRLPDPVVYARWYGKTHTAPELLPHFVYGLCEVNRDALRGAQLIANPGCYPTSVNLGLYPLAKAGLLDERVIIDSKSGISGAGRTTKVPYLFVEANENMTPYSVGYRHRHIAEMELVLNGANSHTAHRFTFTPHLLPVNRGILSTMYVSVAPGVTEQQIREIYAATYAGEPFVHVLPAGQFASLRHVTYSNRCAISITPVYPDDANGADYIIVATIDNLVKGASGQAIQCFNIAAGIEETAGLK